VLDAAAADWVVRQVPHGRRVVRAQRLTGGITSEVTAVTVEDAAGDGHRLVLRRWTGRPWPDGSVDDGRVLVPREAGVLSALETTGIPAPRAVAADPDGAYAGLPALLMTRLPGRLRLTPADPQEWTRQLADQLVAIHAVPPPPGSAAFESWLSVEVEPPRWSADPAPWETALAIARERPVAAPGGFVHHDYQQFNVLWSSRERLSGVVDWVAASNGPPEEDVVHCRTNLCLLYGAELALEFQTTYEQAAGRRTDPWWDVAGVLDSLGWSAAELGRQAGRRLRVDAAAFPARIEALLRAVLARSGA
jgi:aminoglycoside phosphotransferase (APT) family kinase protein